MFTEQMNSTGRVKSPSIFTARVAKQAKVMFLQACVTHSVQQGGGGEEE